MNLFKKWCNFTECREIFVETFIPFIMQIVDQYYQNTPNMENASNRAAKPSLQGSLGMLNNNEERKGAQADADEQD